MSGLFFPRGVAQTGVPFPILRLLSGGAPVILGAVAYVSKDGGAFGAVDNAAYVQGVDGSWFIDPSADEMDAKTVTYKLVATGGINVQVAVVTDASLGPGAKAVTLSFGALGANCNFWVTSTTDTSTAILNGTADGSGDVTIYMDAGSYYVFGTKSGVNFANPISISVSTSAVQSLDLSSSLSAASVTTLTSVYGSIAQGDAYFAERLNTTAWDNATTTKKDQAGKMATRAIDQLDFQGVATEAAVAAGNQFPRGDDTAIPEAITHAQFEESLTLLDDVDPDEEFNALMITADRMSGVSTTRNANYFPEHTRSGIVSRKAWNLLRPYLRDISGVRFTRVS